MAGLIARIQAEPAVVIGVLGAIAVFAVEQFAGKGIITADTGQNLLNLVTALVPLLTGLVTRTQVTPA